MKRAKYNRLAHLDRLQSDKVYRVICAALKEAMFEHGPLTEQDIPSAVKRILGQIDGLIYSEKYNAEHNKPKDMAGADTPK